METALVKSKFVEAIQNYQSVEQQYRTKYKQRMERQFRIGTGSFYFAFATALTNSTSETECDARGGPCCGQR